MENENFFNQVYETVKLIPKGKVSTYGEIARFLGKPYYARQVGWALHKNPYPIKVPCHRVVFSDGSLSSSFAFGGANEQYRLLADEGVTFIAEKVDLKKCFYKLT